MDNKDLKINYKKDFSIVRDLFNLFDPYGLIQGGAPVDEYDCLTTQILSGLYQIKTKQELTDLIITELDHHFGTIDKSQISDNFRFGMDKFIDEIKTKISPAANTG